MQESNRTPRTELEGSVIRSRTHSPILLERPKCSTCALHQQRRLSRLLTFWSAGDTGEPQAGGIFVSLSK